MYELDKVLNKDKVNKKLSTELKKEYRSNVTKFMRTIKRIILKWIGKM